MDNKPLKRHKALQPLSRQHHFGLLFSWKIRKGFSKNIEMTRLAAFTKWFYETEIVAHFEAEEKYVFTILNADHELIIRALEDHKIIRNLFEDEQNYSETLAALGDQLEQHIRFEERVLFKEIQEVATPEQLQKIEDIHQNLEASANYSDPFWE